MPSCSGSRTSTGPIPSPGTSSSSWPGTWSTSGSCWSAPTARTRSAPPTSGAGWPRCPASPGRPALQLEGLGRDDVRACVAGLLGGSAAPPLVDEVLARGQGNPFFTEELVAAHLAGEADPGGPLRPDLGRRRRARRCGPAGARRRWRRSAGRRTTTCCGPSSASTTTPWSRPSAAALDAHLLVVDRTTDAYRFRHALIGEVVYADLLPPERTRLHRRVADALRERSRPTLRPGPTGLASWPSTSTAPVDPTRRSAPCSPPPTRRSGWRRPPRCATSNGPSSCGTTSARPPTGRTAAIRLWQAAELATGAVGNARAAELGPPAFELGPPPEGEAWGHERLARYLWACRPARGEPRRVRPSRRPAPGHERPSSRHRSTPASARRSSWPATTRRPSAGALEALEVDRHAPGRPPAAWVMARRVQGVVRSCLGDPEGGVVVCREAWRLGADRAGPGPGHAVPLRRAARRRPQRGVRQPSPSTPSPRPASPASTTASAATRTRSPPRV